MREGVGRLLAEIQQALHDRALAFRKANTHEVSDYEQFKSAVEGGFALAFWCGSGDCEAKIKEETRATMRCMVPADSGLLVGHFEQQRRL